MKQLFLAIFGIASVTWAQAPSSQPSAPSQNKISATPEATPAAPITDARQNFEAVAYEGVAIDNFAAQESNTLIYSGSAAGAKLLLSPRRRGVTEKVLNWPKTIENLDGLW